MVDQNLRDLAKRRASPPAATDTTTHVWARWGTVLRSSVTYSDPYRDVTVTVTYTGPASETFTSHAFWDGGRTFKIRAAFPSTGTWNWSTVSSDTSNTGLHNKSGTVTVNPYSQLNRLYRRGFLKVHSNNRCLAYTNGDAFNWSGDTAWDVHWKCTFGQWQNYIKNRKAKGINVVQMLPHHTKLIAVDSTAQNGSKPFASNKPTPEYWRDLDQKIRYANDQGIVMYLCGVGSGQTDEFEDLFVTQEFARYIAGRCFGSFVIFSPNMDSTVIGPNNTMGSYLNNVTSRHLITQHTTPNLTNTQNFKDQAYMDFSSWQSGHQGGDIGEAHTEARVSMLALYNDTPVKPVINVEAMYDGRGDDSGTDHREKDARKLGWLTRLSGSAGYTMGVGTTDSFLASADNGVWGFNEDASDFDYWQTAMDWDSNTQLAHMKKFFGNIDWWTLAPAHTLIQNQSGSAENKMVLAKSADGSLGAAFLNDNASIQINMASFSAPMVGRWFNTKTGAYTNISGTIPNSGTQTLTPPSTGEWALELTASGGGGSSIVLEPEADTFLNRAKPAETNGTTNPLEIVTTGRRAYLRFSVTGIPGGATVTNVQLKVRSSVGSATTFAEVAKFTPDSPSPGASWDELTTDYTKMTGSVGSALDAQALPSGSMVTFDLGTPITGNGLITFRLAAVGTATMKIRSREATSADRPELIVTYTP